MNTLPESTPGRARLRQRRRLAPAAAVALAGLLAAAAPAAAQADTQTFTTPGSSVYTVPAGVTQLSITAIGAAGGGWCANGGGGRGASVSGTFPVVATEQLTVSVGGVGGVCGGSSTPGGIGGGGSSNVFGGGGGGASGVSIGTATPTPGSELIVAGGGGGAGAGGGPGGDAGAPGTDPNGLVTPAEPGTQTAGGAGGVDQALGGPDNGGAGAFATGGSGGSGLASGTGGGGGGGGYYGGGGGASSILPPGAGGAGGSSYLALDGSATSGPTVTSDAAAVTITTVPGPAASLSASTLSLGSEPAGSVGPEQTVTLTDQGTSPLDVTGVQPGGADPGDYLIAGGCVAAVAPGASCTIGVRFAPGAQGQSSATLTIVSNSSSTLALGVSGNGVAPSAGPAGPMGATGPAGPAGATGARGPAGPAGTVVCQNTITARTLCSLEFAPGTFSIAPHADVRFTVRRGDQVVRVETLRSTGRHTVIHRRLGRLPRGRYTLVVTRGRAHQRRTLLRIPFRVR